MRKPRSPAWTPPDFDHADVTAIQAVYEGIADPAQQRRALTWIIEGAALTYDQPFRSDADGGDRETTFALGRMFVGQQVVKLMKLSPAVVAQLRKSND